MKKIDKPAKPLLSEDELEEFMERLDTTIELGKKHNVPFTQLEHVQSLNPLDVMLIISTERLDKSSDRLNCLTKILIVLTSFLVVVGIVTIIVMLTSD